MKLFLRSIPNSCILLWSANDAAPEPGDGKDTEEMRTSLSKEFRTTLVQRRGYFPRCGL